MDRKYAFVVMESCRSAKIRGQWPMTNLHQPSVSLSANGNNGRILLKNSTLRLNWRLGIGGNCAG